MGIHARLRFVMKFHVHACVIGLSDRALSSVFKAYSRTVSLVSANGCHGRTAVSFYSSNTSVCLCVVAAVVGACRWTPVPITWTW